MRNLLFSCIILLGFAGGLPAQEQNDGDLIIREYDSISVIVRDEPEYTVRERAVRMDGRISLPSIGELHVSGKTIKQLEAEVTEKLKILVRDPIVQVFVDNVASHYVLLAGQVGKTGHYSIAAPASGSPTTVLDVLVRAGGPTATAKVKNIRIVRTINGKQVIYRFNYKDVLNGKNLQQNIVLENRDYIMVP